MFLIYGKYKLNHVFKWVFSPSFTYNTYFMRKINLKSALEHRKLCMFFLVMLWNTSKKVCVLEHQYDFAELLFLKKPLQSKGKDHREIGSHLKLMNSTCKGNQEQSAKLSKHQNKFNFAYEKSPKIIYLADN